MCYFQNSGPLNVTVAVAPPPVYDALRFRNTHLSRTHEAPHRKERAVRMHISVLFLLTIITVLWSAPSVCSGKNLPEGAAAVAAAVMIFCGGIGIIAQIEGGP